MGILSDASLGHFRFEFGTVLSTILGYEPEVQNPRTGNREIDRRLADDTVDNLILTTCELSVSHSRHDTKDIHSVLAVYQWRR